MPRDNPFTRADEAVPNDEHTFARAWVRAWVVAVMYKGTSPAIYEWTRSILKGLTGTDPEGRELVPIASDLLRVGKVAVERKRAEVRDRSRRALALGRSGVQKLLEANRIDISANVKDIEILREVADALGSAGAGLLAGLLEGLKPMLLPIAAVVGAFLLLKGKGDKT